MKKKKVTKRAKRPSKLAVMTNERDTARRERDSALGRIREFKTLCTAYKRFCDTLAAQRDAGSNACEATKRFLANEAMSAGRDVQVLSHSLAELLGHSQGG